jgi:hypothetical protein
MRNWTLDDVLATGRDAEGRLRRDPARRTLAGEAEDSVSDPARAAVPPMAVNAGSAAGALQTGDAREPRHLSADARAKLRPEQKLQIEMCEAIRPRLVPGGRFSATNIELPGASRLFALFQQIRAAQGAEAGFPDAIVLWPVHNIGFVEVKKPRGEPDLFGYRKARGELSSQQREFRDWCHEWGYPYCSPRSVPEVLEVLLGWGAIR